MYLPTSEPFEITMSVKWRPYRDGLRFLTINYAYCSCKWRNIGRKSFILHNMHSEFDCRVYTYGTGARGGTFHNRRQQMIQK